MKLLLVVLTTLFPVITTYHCYPKYCNPKLCPPGEKHIGCRNNGSFAASCINPATIPITPEREALILHLHNEFRNNVAGGKYPPYKKADFMIQVHWYHELSELAELNCKRCEYLPDCHNTRDFRRSGHNMAVIKTKKAITPKFINETIVNTLQKWFNENENCNQRVIRRFPSKGNSGFKHFTRMVNEKTKYIGCAMCQYDTDSYHNLHLVCNYSYTNVVGESVYKFGEPCSYCRTTCSYRYNNLCDKLF